MRSEFTKKLWSGSYSPRTVTLVCNKVHKLTSVILPCRRWWLLEPSRFPAVAGVGISASDRFNAAAKSCCASQVSHCSSSLSRLAAEGDSSVVSSGDKGGLSRVLFLSGVAARRRFRLSRLPATLGPSPLLFLKQLKGQCHEIFDFRFSTWITFPQTPDYAIKAASNFFENSRRYSQLKVANGKIFNQKNFG